MNREVADRRTIFSATFLVTLILSFLSAGSAQTADQGNVVLRWNQAALDSIAATRTTPAIAARAFAILHTCIFDAWSAYDNTAKATRLNSGLRRPISEHTTANKEKAISFAAYRALIDLFPVRRLSY